MYFNTEMCVVIVRWEEHMIMWQENYKYDKKGYTELFTCLLIINHCINLELAGFREIASMYVHCLKYLSSSKGLYSLQNAYLSIHITAIRLSKLEKIHSQGLGASSKKSSRLISKSPLASARSSIFRTCFPWDIWSPTYSMLWSPPTCQDIPSYRYRRG